MQYRNFLFFQRHCQRMTKFIADSKDHRALKQEKLQPTPWDLFKPWFKPMKVSAKTTLLQEGQVSRTMYFIEKGCLRTWINDDGKEITTQFFFEGEAVSSIESFRTGQPSAYSIESLEPTILQSISQHDFQALMETSPELKKQLEEHLFRRLTQAQQQLYTNLRNSPQQRYEELMMRNPHIVQRVPQHYIASYLGITPVSLSRIRNRR